MCRHLFPTGMTEINKVALFPFSSTLLYVTVAAAAADTELACLSAALALLRTGLSDADKRPNVTEVKKTRVWKKSREGMTGNKRIKVVFCSLGNLISPHTSDWRIGSVHLSLCEIDSDRRRQ